MGIVLGVVVVCIICRLFKKNDKPELEPVVLEIQRTYTLSEMITSIDYGRVYPYYTGMSFNEVESSMLLFYTLAEATKFKEKYSNAIARIQPIVSLPNQNPFIEEIILDFNKNSVVSSITITIKDFSKNAMQLKELMYAKFGTTTPSDGRYITWRNMRMVIRIDEIDGCIDVIYVKV